MKKSKLRTGLITALACMFVSCLGVGAVLGAGAFSSRDAEGGQTLDYPAYDQTTDGHKQFTYGKTYTIDGKKYTLGEGEDECIDFYTALGLDASSYSVRLSRFTYHDGTEGAATMTSVRKAGTYEFEVVSLVNEEDSFIQTLDVEPQKIDLSDASVFRFLNAADDSALLGDVTTIYRNNSGWYPVQTGDEFTFESRAVTNSYVYQDKAITIKIDGEDSSELKYSGISFNLDITNKTGTTFTASGEYVATYTIAIPEEYQEGYSFDYGDELKLSDSYKGLEITNRSAGSFVLTKHWFIVYDLPTIISKEGIADDPYVPFSLNGSATDTVTFGDKIVVNNPAISGDIDKDISFTFEIDYVSADGSVSTTLATKESGGDKVYNPYWANFLDEKKTYYNRITNYINPSMPAGTYTLRVYGVYYDPAEHLVSGEYTLHVLPKSFYAEGAAVSAIQAIQNKLAGEGVVNRYELGSTEVLHADISDEEQTLAGLLSDFTYQPPAQIADTESNYWETHTEYFDDSVEITYNREGQSRNNYVDLSSMLSDLGTPNTYKFYYSISAKNFISMGGPNDENRENYYFQTTLFVSITDIYNYILERDPYFKHATYTGSQVTVSVPSSLYYGHSYISSNNKDGKDYINVGKGASVTLTINLNQQDYYGFGELPDELNGQLEDGVDYKLVDSTTLIVYFDIIKADNSWTVAPTMSPWSYDGFDSSINNITSILAFGDDFGIDDSKIYYRIGTKEEPETKEGLTWTDLDGEYYWLDVSGSHTVKDDDYDVAFFTVTGGNVGEAVAALLKKLDAGTYYLGSYVEGNNNINNYEPTYFNEVRVIQTDNDWATAPGMTGWTYDGFTVEGVNTNFHAGVPKFPGTVTYKLYSGNVNSTNESTSSVVDDITINVTGTSLDSATVAALKALDADLYTLKVSVTGTVSYRALNSYITFRVTQATNAWLSGKTPSISSWIYNEFNEENASLLITKGEATFGTASDSDTTTYSVKYVDSDGRVVSGSYAGDKEYFTYDELLGLLETLSAGGDYNGKYALIVNIPGNGNYSALKEEIRFAVSKATNEWAEEPSITGWTYGEDPSSPTAGTVRYGTVEEYSYKYYKSTKDSLIKGEEVFDLESAHAGYYLMEVIADDKYGNYTQLTSIVPFTIEKATNSFKEELEDRLDWTWGDLEVTEGEKYNKIINSALYNADISETLPEGTEYTIVYTISGADSSTRYSDTVTIIVEVRDGELIRTVEDGEHGDTWQEELLYAFNSMPYGNYRITVTITVNQDSEYDDYNELSDFTSVTVSKAQFTWDTAGTDENGNNYGEPSSTGWHWGEANKNDKIITPSAHTAKNNKVVFSFTLRVNDSSTNTGYTDFDELRAYLLNAGEGKYEITVTPINGPGYTLANYDDTFGAKYTITISESQNDWKEGKAPKASYTSEYESAPDDLSAESDFEAQFGTVTYCDDRRGKLDGVTDVASFIEHIKTLSAGDHTFYIIVNGEAGKYSGLEQQVVITIIGKSSHWKNAGDLTLGDVNAHEANFSYSNEVESEVNDVILPIGNDDEGATLYTIYKDGAVEGVEKTTAEAVKAWILSEENGKTIAGKYVIEAHYTPDNDSYAPLDYTVTLTIKVAKTAWKANPAIKDEYYGDYSFVTVVEPELSQDSPYYYNGQLAGLITITVTNNDNNTGNLYTDTSVSLNEFIKTLDVNNSYYVINWVLAGTGNYDGVTMQCRLYVNRITNVWSDTEIDDQTTIVWKDGYKWTFNRLETISVKVPTATIGEVIISLDGDRVTLDTSEVDVETALNTYLNGKNLKEGSYTLRFDVELTNNYNDLYSICTIEINKNNKEWTWDNPANNWELEANKVKTYSGSISADEAGLFVVPTVADCESLVRFSIAKQDGTIVDGCAALTLDEFRNKLTSLRNDTYTVTAFIGGESYSAAGLSEYNDDYNALSVQCSVRISQIDNGWNGTLEVTSWEWGDFNKDAEKPNLVVPTATEGNDNVVYTVNDGINDKIIYASVEGGAEAALTALKAYLLTLPTGTYSLTISIPSADEYTAPNPLSRAFSVTQVTSKWDDATTNANGETYNWVIRATDNTTVQKPGISTDSKKAIDKTWGTIVLTLKKNGSSVPAPASWEELIAYLSDDTQCQAGTYVITATVAGDDNHTALEYTVTVVINRETTTWKDGKALADYSGGATVPGTFFLPTPALEKYASLLRFDIVPENGDSVTGITSARIAGELAKLANGRFTLTAYVGGTYSTSSDADAALLTEFNTYYNKLSCQCLIELTPDANGWDGDLTVTSWEWGEFADRCLSIPAANKGNDTVVYTVSDGSRNVIVVNASEYGGAAAALTELKTRLKALPTGNTYSLIVSVVATEVYSAPETLNRAFNVTQVVSEWDADTKVADGSTYNWKLHEDTHETIHMPVVSGKSIKTSMGDTWGTISYSLAKEGSSSSYTNTQWSSIISTLGTYGAGRYVITATVASDDNHTALEYSVTVVVSLADNAWKSTTTGHGTDEMVEISWVYGAAGNEKIIFEPEHGTLSIVVNRSPVSYNDEETGAAGEGLHKWLSGRSVGEYVIIATVAATEEYGSLEKTVKVTISKAENTWQNGQKLSISGWTWGDIESKIRGGINFPVALQGASALVKVVVNTTGGAVSLEATINYVSVTDGRTVNDNDYAALIRKLYALDVNANGYKITVTVAETENYSAISCEATFSIAKADNSWDTEPYIEGWNYGGDMAYPTSTAKFGANTVLYRYSPKTTDSHPELDIDDTETWKETLGAAAGEYWLMAYVPGTGNYNVLYGCISFSIKQGANTWVTAPSVIGWQWDNYDSKVNVFSGSARSGGTVKFTILNSSQSALTESDFYRKDGDSVTNIGLLTNFTADFASGENKDLIIALLKALKPGTYTIKGVADANGSFGVSDPQYTQFIISTADNSWLKQPMVNNYTYSSSAGMYTLGATAYGDVMYQFTGGPTGYYTGTMFEDDFKGRLDTLSVGTYNLIVWASGYSDNSVEYYRQSSIEPIVFVVSEAQNSWAEDGNPATSVSGYYGVINSEDFGLEQFEAWFAKPVAKHGTDDDIKYTIMNLDSQDLVSDLTYATLLGGIQGLAPDDYIVRITVSAANYVAFTQNVRLKISRFASSFTNLPANLTGQWQQGETKEENNSVLTSEKITAQYTNANGGKEPIDADEVKYTIQGMSASYTYEEFREVIKSYPSGHYTIIVSVEATNVYELLSEPLSLDISPADDTWLENKSNGIYKPEDSFEVSNWQWKTQIKWRQIMPKYSTKVVVWIVSESDQNTSIKNLMIEPADENQRSLVDSFIFTLGKGTYYLILATPASTNWNGIGNSSEISAESNIKVKFEITTADNEWTEGPTLGIDKVEGRYVWEYETVVNPSASAKWAEEGISITYYDADDTAHRRPYATMPTNVGKYTVVFKVNTPTPLNYQDISEEIEFEITKKTSGEFTVNPGLVGWAWDNYDKETNLFLGTPKSGGKVEFEIIKKDDSGSVTSIEVNAFELDGIYAPAAVIEKLKTLRAGQYYLRVTVAATENYVSFTDDSFYFSISEATNSWEQTPQMMSWSFGNWTTKSAPTAWPKYGTPEMWITSNVTHETIVTGKYIGDGKFEVDQTALDSADIGLYTMHVRVAGLTGCYEGIDEVTVAIEVYVQGSPDEGNFWIQHDLPHINDWVAEIDTVGTPTGTPARGKPYFVFYKAEWNGREWVKVGDAIGKGPDSKLIEGEQYAQPFYVPMAPGNYLMYGCAINLGDSTGGDNLGENSASPSRFTIYEREIAWDQSVSIASVLYLGDYYHGDKSKWGAHSATTTLTGEDVTIRYEYYKLDESTMEREYVGDTTPIEVGTYYIVAYASAKYTAEIPSEMKFEIRLSQNSWTGGTSPSIGNWSEEFNETSPDPEGYVDHGTIKYRYVNKDTGEVYDEKPTQAGNYILYATVEYEGYETLEATYEFTIEPAFDMTLLTICIVLAALASVMLFVVIYFAIRRNREN